jgi:hypothetical protein
MKSRAIQFDHERPPCAQQRQTSVVAACDASSFLADVLVIECGLLSGL